MIYHILRLIKYGSKVNKPKTTNYLFSIPVYCYEITIVIRKIAKRNSQ